MKIDQNLSSFEKFLKNDNFERTHFIPYFRPTFTHLAHPDRTSPSSIKFHQFFKFKTSSPLS